MSTSKNNKINLPEKDYYTLEQVKEKLSCDIQDLFHYAARGHLTISMMMPFHIGAKVSVHGDMTISVLNDFDLSKIDTNSTVDEIKITELSSIYDVSISDEYEDALAATIGGMWDLNMGGAEMFECFGYATTKTIGAIFPTGIDVNINFYAHFKSENAEIKKENLFITRSNFLIFSGGENLIDPPAGSRKPHLIEYHAKKRESVLKAALFMKVNHPELCANNTKWAESINEYAHKFWKDGEPPLAIDTITELLGKALKQ